MTLLHHAGLCVSDMETSLRFYRDCIGMTVLVDKVLHADLEPLIGVHTERVRTIFLGDDSRPDVGIVELIDLGVAAVAESAPQPGLPGRGVFLLSLQVDIDAVLSRLDSAGFGSTRRLMPTPGGGLAATVVDPDGVMVELLARGRLAIMD